MTSKNIKRHNLTKPVNKQQNSTNAQKILKKQQKDNKKC
jgi:hypothetical protein